jgi:hypothetical protein
VYLMMFSSNGGVRRVLLVAARPAMSWLLEAVAVAISLHKHRQCPSQKSTLRCWHCGILCSRWWLVIVKTCGALWRIRF